MGSQWPSLGSWYPLEGRWRTLAEEPGRRGGERERKETGGEKKEGWRRERGKVGETEEGEGREGQ